MKKIFFDSSAILTWYKHQEKFEIVDNYLKQVSNSEILGFICEINLVEILYQIARHENNNYSLAEEFVDDLLNLVGLKKVVADWQTLKQAGKFKMQGNIALPDCILLASCQQEGAKILTSDPEFRQFEKEYSFIWL
jgi:predicted nucleic acid-binding protein